MLFVCLGECNGTRLTLPHPAPVKQQRTLFDPRCTHSAPGNICRSPTAEAMFRAVVEREGVADKFDIDSCGTVRTADRQHESTRKLPSTPIKQHTNRPPTHPTPIPPIIKKGGGNPSWYKPGGWSYHEGDASDTRMTAAAKNRGVYLTSRSRPLRPEDFRRFKYIIGMDDSNIRSIMVRAGGYCCCGGAVLLGCAA